MFGLGEWHSAEEAFALLTRVAWVRISALLLCERRLRSNQQNIFDENLPI